MEACQENLPGWWQAALLGVHPSHRDDSQQLPREIRSGEAHERRIFEVTHEMGPEVVGYLYELSNDPVEVVFTHFSHEKRAKTVHRDDDDATSCVFAFSSFLLDGRHRQPSIALLVCITKASPISASDRWRSSLMMATSVCCQNNEGWSQSLSRENVCVLLQPSFPPSLYCCSLTPNIFHGLMISWAFTHTQHTHRRHLHVSANEQLKGNK